MKSDNNAHWYWYDALDISSVVQPIGNERPQALAEKVTVALLHVSVCILMRIEHGLKVCQARALDVPSG